MNKLEHDAQAVEKLRFALARALGLRGNRCRP